MLKLTRLDHRTVAINPDHIAWVEATPDTTLCLLGDRKIIVRESMDEVIDRFNTARAKGGGGHPMNIPSMPPPSSHGRRFSRPSLHPAISTPSIIDPEDL